METRRQKYDKFRDFLIKTRKKKGITQSELGVRIHKPQNFISKCESGERRLDVVELCTILHALGVKPSKFISELMRKLHI